MASHFSTNASNLSISPPLLNSASPWATTYQDLRALYDCPYTGAVTVRTSLLDGFRHDGGVHQYVFFESGKAAERVSGEGRRGSGGGGGGGGTGGEEGGRGENQGGGELGGAGGSSLNTLGYSPVGLGEYLGIVGRVIKEGGGGGGGTGGGGDLGGKKAKLVILSVTGTPGEVAEAYGLICGVAKGGGAVGEGEGDQGEGGLELNLGMEINLSCPNIRDKPPPAYDGEALAEYLGLIRARREEMLGETSTSHGGKGGGEEGGTGRRLPPVGIKLPPYTYMGQFEEVVGAIAGATVEDGRRSVVDFVTATNTLGSSLVLDEEGRPALASEAGTGIGGLAGAALHPLALGNVATLRRVLDRREETRGVLVIGVGGVSDRAGYERMRKVGAGAVAVATALGREGVGVFEKIARGTGLGLGQGMVGETSQTK